MVTVMTMMAMIAMIRGSGHWLGAVSVADLGGGREERVQLAITYPRN